MVPWRGYAASGHYCIKGIGMIRMECCRGYGLPNSTLTIMSIFNFQLQIRNS